MIKGTAIGRLGKDPELRSTSAGDQVLSFSLAVDHGYGEKKTTTWVGVSLWGKRGEKLATMIRKGEKIAVDGEFFTREHDGRTYLDCRANDVELLGTGKPGNESSSPPAGNTDTDIPF